MSWNSRQVTNKLRAVPITFLRRKQKANLLKLAFYLTRRILTLLMSVGLALGEAIRIGVVLIVLSGLVAYLVN